MAVKPPLFLFVFFSLFSLSLSLYHRSRAGHTALCRPRRPRLCSLPRARHLPWRSIILQPFFVFPGLLSSHRPGGPPFPLGSGSEVRPGVWPQEGRHRRCVLQGGQGRSPRERPPAAPHPAPDPPREGAFFFGPATSGAGDQWQRGHAQQRTTLAERDGPERRGEERRLFGHPCRRRHAPCRAPRLGFFPLGGPRVRFYFPSLLSRR